MNTNSMVVIGKVVRNDWSLTTETVMSMGVGTAVTYEKDGRWIASVVVLPNYSMGSRNDFATEAEALDAVAARALSTHGIVVVR